MRYSHWLFRMYLIDAGGKKKESLVNSFYYFSKDAIQITQKLLKESASIGDEN